MDKYDRLRLTGDKHTRKQGLLAISNSWSNRPQPIFQSLRLGHLEGVGVGPKGNFDESQVRSSKRPANFSQVLTFARTVNCTVWPCWRALLTLISMMIVDL